MIRNGIVLVSIVLAFLILFAAVMDGSTEYAIPSMLIGVLYGAGLLMEDV